MWLHVNVFKKFDYRFFVRLKAEVWVLLFFQSASWKMCSRCTETGHKCVFGGLGILILTKWILGFHFHFRRRSFTHTHTFFNAHRFSHDPRKSCGFRLIFDTLARLYYNKINGSHFFKAAIAVLKSDYFVCCSENEKKATTTSENHFVTFAK